MNKILSKTPIWNFVYSLIFGCFITNPILLLIISTIITIHLIILAYNDVDLNGEAPLYMLLSFMGLPIIIYYAFKEEFYFRNIIRNIKYRILVKLGRRVPDNWDDEKV